MDKPNSIKKTILRLLNIHRAFDIAAMSTGNGPDMWSLNQAITYLMKNGVEPISYGIMPDAFASKRCQHVEGDENICNECLGPILHRWSVIESALFTGLIDFLDLYEEATGEDLLEIGTPAYKTP